MTTTPPGRPGRPATLSTEAIVTAAVAVIDAEGLDALTMRRLGAELGVRAMSLYRHLPNRDAVLAAIVDRVAAGVVIRIEAGASWTEALHDFGVAYRRTLLDHPRAVPLLATRPVDTEVGMGIVAGVLERFSAAGIGLEQATTAIQSVAVFVLGHALAQVGTPPGTDDAGPVATDEFYEHWFATGLEAMVLGLEQQVAR
jgi:TetR/AcrR family tetracycline transcriptional repressor